MCHFASYQKPHLLIFAQYENFILNTYKHTTNEKQQTKNFEMKTSNVRASF